MADVTLANTTKIANMDLALTLGPMEESMRASGKMVDNTGKVCIVLAKVRNLGKESGLKVKEVNGFETF
jgi:hypothetical protein